ncbi:TonB-dependent receptor [Segetibacter koreensis]|uniref:TonB-dependent receptor n=1 Tax=Segetibacter koreensis TaxID=398037 RepID=UPI0003742088|nr:TonB-dependent receptor [Segetibacter koreensis]
MTSYSTICRFTALFGFCIIICTATRAQSVIKGTVKNANLEPLSGASVIIQGSKKGTTTDNNGTYTLSVTPGRHTLIVSYVGLATQHFDVTVTAAETTQDAVLMDAVDLSMVTVIGSRNVSRTRTETAVPVDVIPVSQVINEIGQVDLNQILTFIAPSFQSSRQTVSDGTDHVDPAQLRGLGTDQVLVLVNGKRRHQSALVNVNGTINRGQVSTDLSAIPATAIERIEILRDGAAAQYGSDAIAGVINIVLKKKTGLLEAGVSYGENITSYPKNYALYKTTANSSDPNVKVNDGGTFQGSLGYGFNIGKGYLNLTGEYISRQATNRTGTYTGQIYPAVNGVVRDDSIMQAKGTNRNTFDMVVGNSAMKSGAGAYNFGYPISDNTEIYAFGTFSKKNGEAAGVYRYPTSIVSNAKVYAPNVFAVYPNGFLPQIHSNIIDFSTAVGLRTKFNGWNFDLSNTFGINTFDFGVENSVNYSQFAIAGNNQTKFDAGGLKFWQNTVNADFSKKYNYLEGLNVAAGAEYRIDAFGIKSGEEASYKNFDVPSGAQSGAQVFAGFINTLGNTKTRNSQSIYLDVEQDVTKKLLLTGALRFEHYSDFGSTLNFKFSGRYKISDFLSVRGSISSGFRAPSMQQKYYSKTNTLFVSQMGTLVQQESGTFTNDSKAAQILGIPKLKQETSNNYSVGLTAKPFKGFEITVDAYQIDIKNRIILTNNFTGGSDSLLKQELLAAGATTANFFTNAIDTRSKGLEAVLSYNTNFSAKQSLRTTLAMTFIDNEVKKDAAGKVIIHASDILVNSGQLGNYYNREDQSRMEVASPKNKITLGFNYKYSKFAAMVRVVRFGEVTYLDPSNPSAPTIINNAFTGKSESTDQTFSAKTVTDISLSYDILNSLTATIGANNIFDVYPDLQSHSSNMSSGRFIYSRRVMQMGFNGAYYFARLKFSLDTRKK